MIYLVETRNTVGSFKVRFTTENKQEAEEMFEELKKEYCFGRGYKEVFTMTSAQKKRYPQAIKYAKVGGTHCNYSIMIREFE